MNFDYVLSKSQFNNFNYSMDIGKYKFNYDRKDTVSAISGDKKIILFGDFLDSKYPDETHKQVASKLVETNSIQELIDLSKYLAGRFIILFKLTDENIVVLTDPTCTVPAYYSTRPNKFMVSSSQKVIADYLNVQKSGVAVEIKNSAEEQQPLPYDMTMYEEIKIIIPNHYLECSSQEVSRFFPISMLSKHSLNDTVRQTIDLTKNIIAYFSNKYKLAIPMTAGLDSRTILALFKDYLDEISLYTFSHENFDENTADISIPKQISEQFDIDYYILPREKLPKETNDKIIKEMDGLQNQRIFENAYTLSKSKLSDHSFVPGDIIPLSKSNFGKNLPERLATTNYFVTKSHNYSKKSKDVIEQWVKDIESYSNSYNVSKFDLYFWESRFGRWFPNNTQNYDQFSNPVYIFNCRYMIELWLGLDRETRMKHEVHYQIIQEEWPELLDIPINPDESRLEKLFSTPYMYYIGSYLKYYAKKFK